MQQSFLAAGGIDYSVQLAKIYECPSTIACHVLPDYVVRACLKSFKDLYKALCCFSVRVSCLMVYS